MSLTRFNRLLSRHAAVKSAQLTAGRPIASITFDDFPKSAWALGGPVLARHGARATYYTAGSFCGRTAEGRVYFDAEDLNALKAAGHEIACHSFAHQPTPSLSSQGLADDAARNAAFLKPFLDGGRGGELCLSLWPGLAADQAILRLTLHQCAWRPSQAEQWPRRPGAPQRHLHRAALLGRATRSRDAITRARHDCAWIIFYTHGVDEEPGEYDSTPAMLSEVLGRLAEARIEILPMREAVKTAIG